MEYFPLKLSHDESWSSLKVAKCLTIKDGSPIYVKSSNNSSSRGTKDEVLDLIRHDSITGEYGGGGEDDDGDDLATGPHGVLTGDGGRKKMHSPARMSNLRKKRHYSGESGDTDLKARRSPSPHIGKKGLPGALKFLLEEEAAAATTTKTTTTTSTTSTTATAIAIAATTGSGVITRGRSLLRADTLTESEMMFDLELET
jgi:hypothetical protein